MTDKTNEIGVRIVRLTSGEEVLCNLSEDKTKYTLKKPHILLPQGEGRLAIAPWCPYADIGSDGVTLEKTNVVFVVRGTLGVTLSKEHVIFVVRAGAEMEGQFKEMTTGLIMPPTGMDTSKLKLT